MWWALNKHVLIKRVQQSCGGRGGEGEVAGEPGLKVTQFHFHKNHPPAPTCTCYSIPTSVHMEGTGTKANGRTFPPPTAPRMSPLGQCSLTGPQSALFMSPILFHIHSTKKVSSSYSTPFHSLAW